MKHQTLHNKSAQVTFRDPTAVNGVDGVEVNLLPCDEIVGRRIVGHG
jgi:hypothetical protein